jgi:hypothetical protein
MTTTVQGKITMLQSLLPSGTDVYFALFTDAECTTEIEIARVAYTGWSNSIDGTRRSNTSAISWDAVAEQIAVRGCGWYDESVDGNLIAFGSIRSLLNPDEDEITLETGDIAEIGVGGLRLNLEDA